MDNDEVIQNLEKFNFKLQDDVITALNIDFNMGYERWQSWVRLVQYFFEINLPNYLIELKKKTEAPWPVIMGMSKEEKLRKYFLTPTQALIGSLILDARNNELIAVDIKNNKNFKQLNLNSVRKAFIVHGHDNAKKLETARFLEKIGFEAIILHEQPNGGKTIIEKLEKFTDVGFGIVLYTPDDVGEAMANQACIRPRARQNVVFEHGLLIGKLGRGRVIPLVVDHNIELPGDISGMVYMSDNGWEVQLAREIKALGYDVDFNKLF